MANNLILYRLQCQNVELREKNLEELVQQNFNTNGKNDIKEDTEDK